MNDMGHPYLKGTVAAAALLCAATGAWATTSPSLPKEHSSGSVTYLSGGMAENQEGAMQQVAPKYPLELWFTQGAKAAEQFTTNVPVSIEDHAGNVILDARAAGPMMLATLPDGWYTITAQKNGKLERRNIRIQHGDQDTVVFNWKA
jgi:hypothetical protein